MRRAHYLIATGLTISLGLLSRSEWLAPLGLSKLVGDGLWALMVYWIFSVIFCQSNHWQRGIYSGLFCLMIECQQLYQADWIVELRSNPLVHLVLGSAFGAWDLVAYGAGIVLGICIEFLIYKTGLVKQLIRSNHSIRP